MSKYYIVLCMLFLHIVDDYYLQGILASMKQKKWWEEHAPSPLYKYDYVIALAMHSISWSFMVMLPIAFALRFNVGLNFVLVFAINALLHGTIDNLKANKLKISLAIDQILHWFQIAFTIAVLM